MRRWKETKINIMLKPEIQTSDSERETLGHYRLFPSEMSYMGHSGAGAYLQQAAGKVASPSQGNTETHRTNNACTHTFTPQGN
ncbi:hypothetical protein CHARACLAT_015450 [Characodon lateralis]|uniref:Uncharacterized protein n=1 Tax=Characodon lateralis TaxID=208331 RepID=A0ABU7CQK8_9TELE|nr:hypothetical protein [Characodon lateralis]